MLVFIDESGDSNKFNYASNIFTLAAVCFEEDAYENFDKEFRELKKELFGDESFIIHTVEITRPDFSKDILNLKFNDPEFRKIFYTKISSLISNLDIQITACCILKRSHFDKYGLRAKDPYIFSFENILNRILFRCGENGCRIYPEKRSKYEDKKLQSFLLNKKEYGTLFFKGKQISKKIKDFHLITKKENTSGLELADLIATPINRYISGMKSKAPANEVDINVILSKIPKKCLSVYP